MGFLHCNTRYRASGYELPWWEPPPLVIKPVPVRTFTAWLGRRFVLRPTALSLAGGRLPKFYFVSFWIDDPGKLSVLGIVDLLENVAAFFA